MTDWKPGQMVTINPMRICTFGPGGADFTMSSEEQSISPAEGRAGNSGLDEINSPPLPRGSEQSRAKLVTLIHRALAGDFQGVFFATEQVERIDRLADAILALSTAHAEGLGKEDEYGVQTHVEPQHCTGWRPIDSAPLDGTRVIVGWDDSTSLPMHREMGRYRSGNGKGSGWCNTYGHSFGGDPTHWMPLPAPPSADVCDQQRGSSLEWARQGYLLYTLVQTGWRKGEPTLANQFMVRVERDPRYATDEQSEALIQSLEAFLSSEEQLSSRRCEATCAGNPATDELSLALARQRELETERDDLLVMTGCRDRADLEDMANVGKSLMEVIGVVASDGRYKGWMPADGPAEIVTDLLNDLEDAETRQRELEEALREVRAAIIEHAPDTLWVSLIETAVDCIDAALLSPPTLEKGKE